MSPSVFALVSLAVEADEFTHAAGILDPLKIVKNSLVNASGVASVSPFVRSSAHALLALRGQDSPVELSVGDSR